MKILGINIGHDGSAALVIDGRLVNAIGTERIMRQKKMVGVTEETIQYLLNQKKLSIDDIDIVVCSRFENFELPVPKYYTDEIQYSVNNFMGTKKQFIHVPHHLAHCSSAYYTSNFDKAICLSIDSSSQHVPDLNSSICVGNGNKIKFIQFQGTMIGNAYSEFTEKLNFGPSEFKAGSLMGMSAYGKVPQKLLDNISEYINKTYPSKNSNGIQDPRIYLSFMKEWLEKENYVPSKDINTFDTMNLAAGIQYLFEQTILEIIKKEIAPLEYENLCLSGGSFLNCNTNSSIKQLNLFDNIHHFPACGDDGIAVGAALYVAHNLYDEPRHFYQQNEIALLGKSQEIIDPDYEHLANALSDGKIIAWFMGRSEFGPRALGSRSILADPRIAHNKDILNFVIKKREWFRPFAPVVLEEKAADWFYPGDPSPYMLYTQKVLKKELVPAITHVDGTARIQTLNKEFNPYLYNLIKKFDEKTGVPMLINTSLNGNGQPILETEEDALIFFEENTNMDILVLNGKIIQRQ